MKYFIDHLEKKIHLRQFAGDRCGFTETPIEQREFSSGQEYIEGLVAEQFYVICPHCHS